MLREFGMATSVDCTACQEPVSFATSVLMVVSRSFHRKGNDVFPILAPGGARGRLETSASAHNAMCIFSTFVGLGMRFRRSRLLRVTVALNKLMLSSILLHVRPVFVANRPRHRLSVSPVTLGMSSSSNGMNDSASYLDSD